MKTKMVTEFNQTAKAGIRLNYSSWLVLVSSVLIVIMGLIGQASLRCCSDKQLQTSSCFVHALASASCGARPLTGVPSSDPLFRVSIKSADQPTNQEYDTSLPGSLQQGATRPRHLAPQTRPHRLLASIGDQMRTVLHRTRVLACGGRQQVDPLPQAHTRDGRERESESQK